jgi:hypothetical protein
MDIRHGGAAMNRIFVVGTDAIGEDSLNAGLA